MTFMACPFAGAFVVSQLGKHATRENDVALPWGATLSSPAQELRGNKAIEDAAIAYVMERERLAGRSPRDTRYRGAPADIESPPRVIEVKAFGTSNRGFGLWLETRQVEEARANANFFVYVVENVRQGDPARFTLKVLGGDPLRTMLARAKLRSYYEVPWPVPERTGRGLPGRPRHIRVRGRGPLCGRARGRELAYYRQMSRTIPPPWRGRFSAPESSRFLPSCQGVEVISADSIRPPRWWRVSTKKVSTVRSRAR